MSEAVVNFEEIQNVLEPVFGDQKVKIVLTGTEAKVSAENPSKKILKARGVFKDCANPDMIPGEKGAWERAVVEKYAAEPIDIMNSRRDHDES